MKLFKTGSIDVVKDCQSYFAIDLPSCDLNRRLDKFIVLTYPCASTIQISTVKCIYIDFANFVIRCRPKK